MTNRELWEAAWAATRAEDIWTFVAMMVLLIIALCIYYATGGDKED